MNKFNNKNSLVILCVILFVTYFAQIAPYIHFHHTHNDDGLQIEASFHPTDRNSENHPNQHSGVHHHGSDDHILSDWDYTIPSRQKSFKLLSPLFLNTFSSIEEVFEQSTNVQNNQFQAPPKRISAAPDLSRSPPNYS